MTGLILFILNGLIAFLSATGMKQTSGALKAVHVTLLVLSVLYMMFITYYYATIKSKKTVLNFPTFAV